MNFIKKRLIAKPQYELEQEYNDDGQAEWSCALQVEGYDRKFYGYGSSQKECKRDAAYDFLCFIMGVEDDYNE